MKPVARDLGVARIGATAPVAPVRGVATPVASSAASEPVKALSGVTQTLAASPPVDTDRVARIKKAIKEGDFPILPATIADQMIAYRLSWSGK